LDRDIDAAAKQSKGIVGGIVAAQVELDKTHDGTEARISAEEKLLEAYKKQYDNLERLKNLYLEGDTFNAPAAREHATQMAQGAQGTAKDMEGIRQEIEKNKATLKEYNEFVDFVLEGGGLGQKLPETKHKIIQMDEYGYTLKDWEQFYKELDQLHKEHLRENEREAEHELREAEHMKLLPPDEKSAESRRRGTAAATEYNPTLVDPRAMADSADETKKQTGIQDDIRELMRELLGQGPSVIS